MCKELTVKLLMSTGVILGSLALSSSSASADTINGNMVLGGFATTTNWLDPANPLVPANIPLSAYQGYANANGPTVTITTFPIRFGINCQNACGTDYDAVDSIEFNKTLTGAALIWANTPVGGEEQSHDLTFITTIAGFFNSLIVNTDGFNNNGIGVTIKNNGTELDLHWNGGLTPPMHENDFIATFAGGPISSVPGPIVGAGLPGLVSALGGLFLTWRRKRRGA
jgi:hypothetical protein